MPISRRVVLERLATETDADSRETMTVEALAAGLDTDERTVEAHLQRLADCELARIHASGRVRVTITGEEILELGADEVVIVDRPTTDTER
ncbi:hypothetical protein KM295_11925 [Natronomonas sp. F2-12]|jgi:Mn-dependent DtxR family transcriptional regulator|uniref:Uncharacterized protein n=1 Tax=Natronomonas aquatica TaxID=2841590 RepID=A0A9R1CUS6_9EURY|nr:hypothetical protein [Natronomonas aquatica]MCQ4334173.1 hypothetical protein [Natronomonas aquatica]